MSDFQTGFKNPKEDPGSTQRIILAFILIFAVIVGAQYWMAKHAPPPQKPAAAPSAAAPIPQPAGATAPAQTGPALEAATATPATASAAPAASKNVPTKQAVAESETVVENSLYKITFTNKGAAVKSWILKDQQDNQGHPLDLVNQTAAAKYGYPLSLYTYDADLTTRINSALFVARVEGDLSSGIAKADKTGRAQAQQIKQAQTTPVETETVTFEYAAGDTEVRKIFRFDQTYVVHADVEVTRKGAAATALLAWPAGFGDQTLGISFSSSSVAYDDGDSITRLGTSKSFFGRTKAAVNGDTIKTTLAWAGPLDQYFTAIFLPDDPQHAQLVTFNNTIPQDAKQPNGKTFPVLGAAVGNVNGPTAVRLFVGPKILRILSSVHATEPGSAATTAAAASYTGPSLGRLIDFGFFGFIAKPLFIWLRWTYEHIVPNWGWAILLVTLIITVAMLPLRVKQVKSSMRMMKAQPLVDAIKGKYKGIKFPDPRLNEQNKEIQELYKREGINPIGGCIPVLFQMPLLYAFFKVLEITVELRHAHWLWIPDLSSPDPLHIVPIVLFLSMIWLQTMTPTPGVDAMQARMMQFTMPLVFGWMAWNFAAGLSVYYTASNLISIGQQLVMNRTALGREMREIQARRALKGKGKAAAPVRAQLRKKRG